MEHAHALSVGDIEKELRTQLSKGLPSSEIATRQAKYGKNELPDEESTPLWKLILEQFDDLMVKILLAAAVISFVLALFEEGEDSTTAFMEPAVIMTILILNAIVGVWQEKNAESAIEALKQYEPDEAKVLRDGHLDVIRATELVPGDVIEIHVGDKVPADMRVSEIFSTALRIDQSILTGESVAVGKDKSTVNDKRAEIQSKTNLCFSGTTVSYGRARGIVIGTGLKTEIGKIGKEVSSQESTQSPLKKKLDDFGELLTKMIGVICVLVWAINFHHFTDPIHGNFFRGAIYYFKIAVALAVAAIPEGLPAVVTTCLALGTRRMAKKNAIVRYLPSVETLGCTTVICSDKTGTLTTNQMSVQKALVVKSANGNSVNVEEYSASGTTYAPEGKVTDATGKEVSVDKAQCLSQMMDVAVLCNSSSVRFNADRDAFEMVGEATEAALLVFCEKLGTADADLNSKLASMSKKERAMAVSKHIRGQYTTEATLEFTRDRKSMSVVVKDDKEELLYCKGATESIINRCNRVLLDNGNVVDMSPAIKDKLQAKLVEYGTGKDTLRCLGFAFKDKVSSKKMDLGKPEKFEEYEKDMIFVGIMGMIDPPRPEVRDSIETCRAAGIRVVVITGDNKATATAICKRIGVFGDDEDTTGKAYTGREFDDLSEKDQREAVARASLFARTEPSHKMRIVQLLQDVHGEVAAMTGDGVNDAPALKKADIGVAMGSGTAVAKGAGDMVLADDNFSTIVAAVEEGRAIFNNTKAFIRYLISSNIGEVAAIFLGAALGTPEALVPVQLLWVNLVTDGLPATALSFNPPEKDVMRQPPRDPKEQLLSGWTMFRYMVIGVYVGVAVILGLWWWFCFYEAGPQITWWQLTHFQECQDNSEAFPFKCSVFHHDAPPTIALSILVTIEMFNALNAVSEQESLLTMPPFVNPWLVIATVFSFAQHLAILYVPAFQSIFGVVWLNWEEWKAVLAISFPVIMIDEVLKFVSRIRFQAEVARRKKEH